MEMASVLKQHTNRTRLKKLNVENLVAKIDLSNGKNAPENAECRAQKKNGLKTEMYGRRQQQKKAEPCPAMPSQRWKSNIFQA